MSFLHPGLVSLTKGAIRLRRCLECGDPMEPSPYPQDFCGRQCQRTWNNRRAVRGAEMYDLVMALRYDRETAKALKLWKLLCRMAQMFRDEDRAQRDGRRSWKSPHKIIESHQHLRATVVATNITGRRH